MALSTVYFFHLDVTEVLNVEFLLYSYSEAFGSADVTLLFHPFIAFAR